MLLNSKAKRRLFNIDTHEVSVVDTPANMRKFLVVKNDEGGTEMKEVLEKIEKHLNDMVIRLDSQDARIKALEPTKEELAKVGAKFSSATTAQLRAMHQALSYLLEGAGALDEQNHEGESTKKTLTPEEINANIAKGLKSAMTTSENKDNQQSETMINAIAEAVSKILEKK